MELLRTAEQTGRRRRVRMAGAVTAGAVGLALSLTACSNSGGSSLGSKPAAQAVPTAADNLVRQSSISMTFSLPITSAQAQQIFGRLSPSEQQAIMNGSVFLQFSTGGGEPLNSPKALTDTANAVDIGLTINGSTPVEIRYVSKNLYVHLQAAQLATDIGISPDSANKLSTELAKGDQYVPGLNALGQGNWVELSNQSFQQNISPLIKQYNQSSGGSALPSGSEVQSLVTQTIASLVNSIKTNTTFTSMGSQNGRLEYGANFNVSAIATAAAPIIQHEVSALPLVGSRYSSAIGNANQQVPQGVTATANLFVANNKLSEIDFTQASVGGKFPVPVPVKIVFGTPGSISAPSGAQQLDLSKIAQMLQGLMQNAGSGG